ncbi:MAG: TVP38/TMEM64 family protein [Humidesulfovibrio sp.]|nr:TVP38/TMEM64 family protein [Humidesulfovibrio sp.]
MLLRNTQQASSGAAKGTLRKYIGPKRLCLLVGYACIAAFAWHYWRIGILTPENVLLFISKNSITAPVLFIVAYALIVVFMIPSLPLNLGAGFLWGPFLGSIYTLIGCTLGSTVAFLFARTALGQPLARKFDNNILQWLMGQISKKEWQVVAFIRVNPAFPSGPVNYLLGLTSISFKHYFWASLVASYPLCLAFAYVGEAAGGIMLHGAAKQFVQLLLAVSITVCVGIAGRITYKYYFKGQ